MSFVVRDRLPSWTRVAPSGLNRTVGSSNRTERLIALSPFVNPASPTPVRRAATMASCGSPRMASAAYRRTSSFSGSVNLSKTSWTSTSGPASAVLIRMPMGRSPSGRTSASRHESRGESDATTLSGGSPSPSKLIVRRPRYSSATSASFTPRLSSSSSASRSARLARLDASMSMTSVSIGVCIGSADSQIPVSGTRTSGDGEVMCGRVLSICKGFLELVPRQADGLCGSDVARSLDAPENLPKEGVVDLGIRVRTREEPDSADLFRLLRPSRERRKSETDSENDREPDQSHGTPRWRMAGGSLAERDDAHQHGAAHHKRPAAVVSHSLIEPAGASDLASQRERPPELDPDHGPRFRAPARHNITRMTRLMRSQGCQRRASMPLIAPSAPRVNGAGE